MWGSLQIRVLAILPPLSAGDYTPMDDILGGLRKKVSLFIFH